MTPAALGEFQDAQCDDASLTSAPGPVVLYGCGQHRLTAIPDKFEEARSDAHYVQFEIELSGVNSIGDPIHLDEHVSIGRGIAVGSAAEATQVVLQDRSN